MPLARMASQSMTRMVKRTTEQMSEGWSSMMKRTSDGQAVSAEYPFFVCFAILVNYKLKHRGKSLLVASDGLNGLGILND